LAKIRLGNKKVDRQMFSLVNRLGKPASATRRSSGKMSSLVNRLGKSASATSSININKKVVVLQSVMLDGNEDRLKAEGDRSQ
jgi:hypothetical protein